MIKGFIMFTNFNKNPFTHKHPSCHRSTINSKMIAGIATYIYDHSPLWVEQPGTSFWFGNLSLKY